MATSYNKNPRTYGASYTAWLIALFEPSGLWTIPMHHNLYKQYNEWLYDINVRTEGDAE